MERLTKQYGDRIYINKDVIPSACSKPEFCKRVACRYAGDRENCPSLKVLYRLAELEQKIENGELVEKEGTH